MKHPDEDCRYGHNIYWVRTSIDKIRDLVNQYFKCRNCGKVFSHTMDLNKKD